MNPDNQVAFVLQLVFFGDERRHLNCRIYGHRAGTVDTGTELPEQGNSQASQMGLTRTSDLSVIHFTEKTRVKVTKAQTDINIPWHKHVPRTHGQLPQNEGDIQ
jgi:hypothetical protein